MKPTHSLRPVFSQSYNEPDIARSSDFHKARGAVLPETILLVSKQEWYNCVGLQE